MPFQDIPKTSLSIYYCNSRSILNKIDSLSILLSKTYDILIFTESWLNSNIIDSTLIGNSLYTVSRLDRKTKGGGILVLISNLLPFQIVVSKIFKKLEILCFDIFSPTHFLSKNRICVIYRPPDLRDRDIFIEHLEFLEELASQVRSFLLIGDFNLPKISWEIPFSLQKLSPFEQIFTS